MADSTQTDPLGRTITLHDATWLGHILANHREMENRRPDVERAIESPDDIRFSKTASSRRLYHMAVSRRYWVVVVADIERRLVLTAYRARKPKGVVEWSRSTRSKG